MITVTEQDLIDSICDSLPESGGSSSKHVDAVDEALRRYPESTRLWLLRGDLIQTSNDVDDGRELEDACRSYERALEIDRGCSEVHRSLGHYFDAMMPDPALSRFHFRRAADLRGAN
jgi:Tfp pilus assembly protein PilF